MIGMIPAEAAAMARKLKHVDPSRPAGPVSRAYAALANTGLGRWMSSKVMWKLDPWLMHLTGGRVGMGLVLPTALLETRGARTGMLRRNAVIYFHDGERVTIVASKMGLDHDPAWLHNLRADPDVRFGGVPMRAAVVDDEEERRRLWPLADNVFAPYAAYRRRAAQSGRTIPIVQLSERAQPLT
jgi:deazaflavin-dependent oxidoreductase (nitroreductase family)